MNGWIELPLSLLGGILLGVFYFGGLWWTVTRLSRTEKPAIVYLSSLIVRTAILVLSFFNVSEGCRCLNVKHSIRCVAF